MRIPVNFLNEPSLIINLITEQRVLNITIHIRTPARTRSQSFSYPVFLGSEPNTKIKIRGRIKDMYN